MISSLLPIEGTFNFRDLGGFRADGGHTKSGTLFRSDALAALSERGREQIAELSVTRVIDLRDDAERGPQPDLVPENAVVVPHPIFPDVTQHISAQLDIYQLTEMLYLEHGDRLASAVTMLAEPGATVFHCTAGKDRTGAVAALTLLAVGVDRDDVMHDYAASEHNLSGEWRAKNLELIKHLGIEVTPELEQLLVATPLAAIERALHAVDERFGSVRDYLRVNDVTDATIERLHAQLVE
ncbi:tyrosine-protein phosphatase [Leucobacter sp. VD1]|uniref:tyrosine-protein phosphatase n=1 Tax=Leucobacter sp. VD1 TaxID=3080381 RepID=UPI003018221C